jgi:hypothetical protein
MYTDWCKLWRRLYHFNFLCFILLISVALYVRCRSVLIRGSVICRSVFIRGSVICRSVFIRGSVICRSVLIRGSVICRSVLIRGSVICRSVLIRGSVICRSVLIRGSMICRSVLIRGSVICRSVLIRGSVIFLSKRGTSIVSQLPVSVNLTCSVHTRSQSISAGFVNNISSTQLLPLLTDIFTKICAQIGFTYCSDVHLGYNFGVIFITDTHRSLSLPPLGGIWK